MIVADFRVNTIFSGNGYTLGNAVAAGDVLDFQGEIDLQHSLVINKQVTIKSTTKDAVVKLNTPTSGTSYSATVMYPQSFVINKAGSGTTVQDIRIENTETWIYNTSNVTFTGVTMWVEEAKVGSGLGHVALRYSDHITFDGCTVYTKNNGGSSACALTGSHDCTFKDTRFENAGNVGNILYIGNPYNIQDKPADYTMNNDNISMLNCTITAESSGAISQFKIVDGLRHRIENCTVNFVTSFGCAATASEDGFVIRNNTFTQGLSIPKASTVTNNNVTGNVTISANNATVSGNTVYLGSTITGNSILGKVTFSNNSKNNTFTGNTVISSEAYAVVMASTADANNTVTDNILLAASNTGDAAVNPSTGTGNTISDNLSEAATGDVTWNFDATTGTLTIGGTGAMADFEQTTGGQTTAPWAFLSDKITRVVIGEGVTKVGSNAFAGCKALNDVFVKGAGTLTIGTAAFDATKTPAIYVPVGTEATYQTAWSAYAGSISGYMSCGDNVMAVYDATTHTLTICGKGAMTDFASAADQPWKALQGDVQTVCFEPFITAIGANAFSGCSALTAVNIEGTLTIADGAFDGNATGRRIFVPVSAIAGYGESTYASDIYSVGQCGAEGSDVSWELKAQTMALNILGTGAMADYASDNNVPWTSVRGKITSATIAEGVTSVGKYAFSGCSILNNVSIPATVTAIGERAFYNCSGLTAISIPEGVTTIGANAFRGCSKLESINLPAGLTTIGDYAFSDCAALTAIVIPDGVTTISRDLFDGCTNLATVTIPDGVTSIGNYAFYDCSMLKSITIPASVTSVGSQAFSYCSKLESITLPASVTSIGTQAFRDCSLLTEVNIFAPSLTTYGSNAFQNTPAGLKIYVPAASVDTYKSSWSAYADKFAALPYYALTMKEGTQDADKWTVKAGTDGSFQSLPLEGVKAGTKVKLKYDGDRSMLKGVKAVKKGGAVDNAYLKWDGTQKKLVSTEMPESFTTVTSENTEWSAGTYVVEGQVSITGTITLKGNVDLIIKDGAKLTAKHINGFNGNSSSYNLSIYGQANQTGELVINRTDGNAIMDINTLEVHSAKVTATSSADLRGGFSYISTFNVYGGLVDAKNTGSNGFGIYLKEIGYMNIYGGEVKAEGKGSSYGITSSASISMDAAYVRVYGGKLWAGNANNRALNDDGIYLTKGTGFTGKIEYSSDNSTWSETPDADAKYVRAGY